VFNLNTGLEVDCVSKIPAKALEYWMNMPFESIVTPFVKLRIGQGDSIEQISDNYDLEFHKVRRIRKNLLSGKK